MPKIDFRQYNRLAALPFFKRYPRWKPFMEWKGFVRVRKWFKCRLILEDLFVFHPLLRIGELDERKGCIWN